MAPWRQLRRGLRSLFRRSDSEREVSDELQDYLERAAAQHQERGLPPDEARRAARLELGSELGARQEVRESGWENGIATLAADLRYAARRLRLAPGFTVVAVITLALGLGATAAIFSAVHAALFRPLPYPAPERIAMVWYRGADGARVEQAFGTCRELAERSGSFDSLAAMKRWQPTLTGGSGGTGGAEPERLEGQRVGAAYFRVLGIPPRLGRAFQPAEDTADGPRVVVLSDRLWRRRFAADPSVVGRSLKLDGDPYVVAGVMPPGFENVPAPEAELWTPLQYDLSQGRAWGHHLRLLGRLRPDATEVGAREELARIARSPLAEFPRPEWAAAPNGFFVDALQEEVTRGVRPALLAILGAVVLVLAIACVNVANLILARNVQRQGEMALRAALGGGHGRLVRQMLTESLLLAALGGAAGLAVAYVGNRAFAALSPADLQRTLTAGGPGASGPLLAAGFALTTLLGLLIGLIPALRAASSDPQEALQRGSRRSASAGGGTRSVLVVAEVALTLVLLVCSGLLLRSVGRLFAVEPGFDPHRVLTLQVQTSGHRFDAEGAVRRFFDQALEAVRRTPGVEAAALTSQLPLSSDLDQYGVHFDPSPTGDPGEVHGSFRYAVSPGYFEALRIPLRRGRYLTEADREGAPLAAVISESMARRRLPGRDPVGLRLKIGDGPLYQIVGVVGDVKQVSLALAESDAVYVTVGQWRFPDNALSLVVRTRSDPAALAPAVRQAVWSVDKDQPIVRVTTMDSLIAASAAGRRFALFLFAAFALTALVLAAAGIYGLLAGSVAERLREIGVRAALGASRGEIVSWVLGKGMRLTGLAIVLGLAAAAATSRALTSLLFGVSGLDPATYLGTVALLAGVAALACGVPAWRAARIDPAITLRAE